MEEPPQKDEIKCKVARDDKFPPCCRFDLRKAEEGFSCVTEKVYAFQLIRRLPSGEEIWQDQTSKLLWISILNRTFNYYDAKDICRGFTADGFNAKFELPDRDVYQAGYSRKMTEILPQRIIDNQLLPFWTSSIDWSIEPTRCNNHDVRLSHPCASFALHERSWDSVLKPPFEFKSYFMSQKLPIQCVSVK